MMTDKRVENLIKIQKQRENEIADELAKELERAYEYVLTLLVPLGTKRKRTFVHNDLANKLELLYNEIVSIYPDYEDELSELLPNKYGEETVSIEKYIKIASTIAMLVFIKSFLEHMFSEIDDEQFNEYKDNPVLGYKLIDRLTKNVRHIIYIIGAWSTTFIQSGKLEDKAFKVSKAHVMWFKKMVSDYLTYYTRYETLWDMYKRGVEHYTFYTSEDERVCDECGAIHENTYLVTNAIVGTNFPPIHNGCRCWIVEDN